MLNATFHPQGRLMVDSAEVPANPSDLMRLVDVPFDRAWGVLLGASLCLFCGAPAVIYYTFGLFLPEIIANTHWQPAVVAAAIGPGALVVAFTAPLVGRISDRIGVRKVALAGGPAFATGLTLLGLLPQSAAGFVAATMLMYLLAFAGSPIPYAQALSRWFDRRRGMAIGVMFCVGAIGIAVWPSYAAMLIACFGWRTAYIALGWTAGLAIFGSGLLLLRVAPEAKVGSTFGHDGPVPGLTVAQALRTSRFWKTAVVFALLSGVLGGAAVQFPVILRLKGADPQIAAAMMSVVGASMFLGRLALGVLLDRWFAPRITVAVTMVSMLTFGLLLTHESTPALVLAAAFLGFGLGSEYAIAAYLVSRAFGLNSYGAIYGLVSLATGIGLALGPALMGIFLVTGANLSGVCWGALMVLVFSVALLLTFRRDDLPFGAARTRTGFHFARKRYKCR
jgi:MFS family permease